MSEKPIGIFLQPIKTEMLSWKETFRQAATENQSEVNAWEVTIVDGLDEESFEGWSQGLSI